MFTLSNPAMRLRVCLCSIQSGYSLICAFPVCYTEKGAFACPQMSKLGLLTWTNIHLGVTCQNQHRHPLRVFLRNSVFAVSFKIKQPLVRNNSYLPTACYSGRCPSMSVERSYLVVAGHLRMLYPSLLQTCSSKARMPAVRCYQSCRRLPSIAQKTGLHRLLHSHQTPPRQRLHQSALLQRPLELVLARRLSFSLRRKALQDPSQSCIWHSRCTCGFSPLQPPAGRRGPGLSARSTFPGGCHPSRV